MNIKNFSEHRLVFFAGERGPERAEQAPKSPRADALAKALDANAGREAPVSKEGKRAIKKERREANRDLKRAERQSGKADNLEARADKKWQKQTYRDIMKATKGERGTEVAKADQPRRITETTSEITFVEQPDTAAANVASNVEALSPEEARQKTVAYLTAHSAEGKTVYAEQSAAITERPLPKDPINSAGEELHEFNNASREAAVQLPSAQPGTLTEETRFTRERLNAARTEISTNSALNLLQDGDKFTFTFGNKQYRATVNKATLVDPSSIEEI